MKVISMDGKVMVIANKKQQMMEFDKTCKATRREKKSRER
jgi:hypothetical protein